MSAERRMRRLCGEIIPGTSFSALRDFADEHGLNPPQPNSSVAYIAEAKTFGRWACQVELKNGVVESATYKFSG